MFTDELAGNPAKKRADEAKARRIRAKREKEAKEARKRKELERQAREASAASVAPSLALSVAASAVTIAGSTSTDAVNGQDTTAVVGDASTFSQVSNVPNANGSGSSSTTSATATTSSTMATPSSQNNNGAPLTAAQKAMEQRKLRAEARARVTNATIVQSFVRSKLTAVNAREEQRRSFDKRMSDLIALAAILKQRLGMQQQQQPLQMGQSLGGETIGDYVPPPATATIMTIQFLFFACPSIIQKQHPGGEITMNNINTNGSATAILVLKDEDLSRWAKLVRHVLLPGVMNENLDLDPLLPWMETDAGRRRLEKIVCLCVSSISQRWRQQVKGKKKGLVVKSKVVDVGGAPSECYSAVDSFLRTILRLGTNNNTGEAGTALYNGGSRDVVYQKCRSLLMQSSSPTYSPSIQSRSGSNATVKKDHPQNACKNSDLITALRTILLYGSNGNSKPIPPDAERLRENCIKKDERERISLLTRLVVDLIASLESLDYNDSDKMTLSFLCARFVSEVLTVPLLTWKVIPSAYQRILRGNEKTKSPPPMVKFIHHFINWNAEEVSNGRVEVSLNMTDVSLSLSPAPAVLCLLANLIQIGMTCDALNGLDQGKLHYKAAAEYFNFLATLINAAPQGTFSSRMSAVEWVSVGSTSSPIVLSDVVIDQASTLLSDAYVRALFKCAINDEALGTQNVIITKSDKDKKHEQDLDELGTTSASSVAAKEAMVDRNKSFWQSSKWAKKLTNLISGSGEKMSNKSSSSNKGVGQLMNTSSIARQLANGKGSINRTVTNAVLSNEEEITKEISDAKTKIKPQHEYSILFFLSLCRAYGTIISRWGGGGKEDLVKRVMSNRESAKEGREYASATLEPCVTSLLNVLCFSTSIVASSWAIIQSNPRVVSDLYAVIDVRKRAAPVRTLNTLPGYKYLLHSHYGAGDGNVGAAVLLMFISCLSHTLIVTDDVEIHDMEKPLPKHHLRRCILLLKKLLYRACCLDDVHETTKNGGVLDSNHFGLALISSSSKAMNDLYNRSSRRRLCVPKLWIEEDLLEKDLKRCKTHLDFVLLLSSPVCRICPFLISFKRRLKLFERIVTTNRVDIQGSNDLRNLKPGIMVKVMRGRVLEDGLLHLNNLGRNMRQRIVVGYLSEAGTKESGVDVGGLFKEFWTDLSNMAFNPNYALFKVTEGSEGAMYPNPSSKFAHGSDHIVLFEFLGRILGKALYEGITIQPQFAHLFLSFLRGDKEFLHLLTDLSTIDLQLYNNLMFLKTYDGDASDLCLTFTVANDDFGVNEVPLLANGANIEVTNTNKQRYIYLVAKHHVCDRIKEQSDAFTRGLWEVIDRSWLRLFNEPELQVLISGASDGKIDVSDMKSNTRYTGGYSMLDRNIVRFWNAVSSLTPKQQADLLRFVTSCERPPPLGFASMNPPFTIQRVGIMRDGEKLPTAATCFNTLKLPTYSSEKVLKDRLIYAIESGSGFELT